MKKFAPIVSTLTTVVIMVCMACVVSGCSNVYNNVYKTEDYAYKYEQAKEYYAQGRYQYCSSLLEQLIYMLKTSSQGEEALFMNAMCYYNQGDYETSSLYFERYYKSYPKGTYTELARFFNGCAAFYQSPDPRLDQTPTVKAMQQLQEYLEFYPYSKRKDQVTDMLFTLQNRLVEKEYRAAKLYYNLGNYVGNCTNGGSNFEACILTAENALKTYPYTSLREDLYMMILKSRYRLAQNSVEEKAEERYRQVIDEYYGFRNEFPDSKHMKDADDIFTSSSKKINKRGVQTEFKGS